MSTTRRQVLGAAAGGAVMAAAGGATAGAAGSMVSITTPGGQTVSAYLAKPATSPAPAVLLVHEWWGLNEGIKAKARDYAEAGYVALAVDMYGGKVTDNPDEAAKLMQSFDTEAARDAMAGWIPWLRDHADSTGKVGTVGWCLGGAWSLNASLVAPVDATVIYYGMMPEDAESLAPLAGPALGHFAKLDTFIPLSNVEAFEAAMAKAGKDLTVHIYDAHHAFSNPAGPHYDAAASDLARERTLAFFAEHLR